MADLAELRAGLAANLSSISGLQESAYLLANPTPPAAEIQPDETEYDKSMGRGTDLWRFIVRVFVANTSDIAAQKKLDLMLASHGSSSVKQALESDPTLDGAADDLRVVRCSGYRIYSREGWPAVLGAEWQVEVYAKGDQ